MTSAIFFSIDPVLEAKIHFVYDQAQLLGLTLPDQVLSHLLIPADEALAISRGQLDTPSYRKMLLASLLLSASLLLTRAHDQALQTSFGQELTRYCLL